MQAEPRKSAVDRWAAERTRPVDGAPRQRARHLPEKADANTVLQHNAWDDVELTAQEVAAAEQVVQAQPMAPAHRGDECRRQAASLWDAHYAVNLRNYHDRRYLHNEYPSLLCRADGQPDGPVVVLETGCGVGNTLLPLLLHSPHVSAVGCDHAAGAVVRANERLEREGLAHRGRAICWDLGQPPPEGELPASGFDTILSIFTLSALPPEALPLAFAHLVACLKPGGQLLIRDYGRLDMKQLKFAKAAGGRLGSGHGCEWYARGDGTTALFFTTEAVATLARQAGLEVSSVAYDRRLVVNRADRLRMNRVWVVAQLRKPVSSERSSAVDGHSSHRLHVPYPGGLPSAAPISLAAACWRWRHGHQIAPELVTWWAQARRDIRNSSVWRGAGAAALLMALAATAALATSKLRGIAPRARW